MLGCLHETEARRTCQDNKQTMLPWAIIVAISLIPKLTISSANNAPVVNGLQYPAETSCELQCKTIQRGDRGCSRAYRSSSPCFSSHLHDNIGIRGSRSMAFSSSASLSLTALCLECCRICNCNASYTTQKPVYWLPSCKDAGRFDPSATRNEFSTIHSQTTDSMNQEDEEQERFEPWSTMVTILAVFGMSSAVICWCLACMWGCKRQRLISQQQMRQQLPTQMNQGRAMREDHDGADHHLDSEEVTVDAVASEEGDRISAN